MKCSKCGNEYMDTLAACPVCFEKDQAIGVDTNAFRYAVFGFFLPLVAMYQAKKWCEISPMKAKTTQNGARLGLAFLGSILAVLLVVIVTMNYVD